MEGVQICLVGPVSPLVSCLSHVCHWFRSCYECFYISLQHICLTCLILSTCAVWLWSLFFCAFHCFASVSHVSHCFIQLYVLFVALGLAVSQEDGTQRVVSQPW